MLRWPGIAALLLAAPAAGADAGGYPPRSVLLFVASWCAPCRAELARLPAITRGARPFRVLVVPFDDRRATLAMIEPVPAAQRWQPDRATLRRIEQEMTGETRGLPFSIAVDGEGRVCGTMRQGLDASSAEALVAACLR